MTRDSLKRLIQSSALVDRGWAAWKRKKLLDEFRSRRRAYSRRADEQGVVYDPAAVRRELSRRLGSGRSPRVKRETGAIRTFAFIAQHSWHPSLLPDLAELGPLTLFDYTALGVSFADLLPRDGGAVSTRRQINRAFVSAVKSAHAAAGVDWVFVYANGYEVERDSVRAIVDACGVPCVIMSLDDRHSWEGDPMGSQRTGIVDLSPVFDLVWTSSRLTCEWHMIEGGRPMFMPEGFDSALFAPRAVDRNIPVSFVGSAYGHRRGTVRALRSDGIPIEVYGHGWPSSHRADDPVDVFCRSRINLGMGGIGYAADLVNLKGRDFEIPGTGGGMYLTTYNAELAPFFDIGREIVCYRNYDEMLELIRYYRARPVEAEQIAAHGRSRALAEHRWLHRYHEICRLLGLM